MTDETPVDVEALRETVIATMKTVYDPEIPVNIYDLGMVYTIDITPGAVVNLKMTLTSPACPVAGTLPYDVQIKVGNTPGVASANVELVWDPPWNQGMITEAARLELGLV